LTNATASAGGTYLQTPVRVSIGISCSGCFANPPIPVGSHLIGNPDDYIVTITSLELVNYNPASQYTFRDLSGSAESVIITLPPPRPKLSNGAIAGIAVLGIVCIIVVVGAAVYFHRTCRTKKQKVQTEEIPGARTKFTEDQPVDSIPTADESIMRALRYPEEGELGGRLGQQ
jgi:hypothetical protein